MGFPQTRSQKIRPYQGYVSFRQLHCTKILKELSSDPNQLTTTTRLTASVSSVRNSVIAFFKLVEVCSLYPQSSKYVSIEMAGYGLSISGPEMVSAPRYARVS